MILFAMVGTDYKFLWTDFDGKGSCTDAQIFNTSALKQRLENDSADGWPHPDPHSQWH